MRAVVIEVTLVVVQHDAGVSLVVDQQPVGALLADATNEPFGVAVRLGCLRRDLDHLDIIGGENGIEGGGELGVPVTEQEAERTDPLTEVHQQVAGCLGGPGCRRMSGHAQDVHRAGAHFHEQTGRRGGAA